MEDKEFQEKVYEKYRLYKHSKDDNFFNKKIYKKSTPSILKIASSFIIILFSVSVVLVGGLSTYALITGENDISKPILKWFRIGFSDEYSNYVEIPEEEQIVAKSETEVTLLSTMCSEGFTVLEFDVSLSQKDKEYLRLGQSIVTEKDIENMRKYLEEYKKQNLTQEQIERMSNIIEKQIKQGTDQKNSVKLIFVPEPYEDENGNKDFTLISNNTIFIDGEKQYTSPSGIQTTVKVNDYEYKVYLLFLLTDKNLKGKEEFTLSLKNAVLANGSDISNYKTDSNTSMVLRSGSDNYKTIEIGGEFNISLSKRKSLENTKIIKEGFSDPIKYKNMTESVKEVVITPMQTIVKLDTVIEKLSLRSLSNTTNKDHIGIISYKAYDEDGNELPISNYEIKRTVTYADGTVEEWAPGDIGTYKSFYNGRMDLTKYIILENNDDISKIIIKPTVEARVYKEEEQRYVFEDVELDSLEINLEK